MECNRDEASRAKEIAERKFTAKDIASAKKFALKAYNLYPGLDGIPQMVATFDVYLAAEKKLNGETDWYAILNVNATADDETVKKQYRKLALILHPDKNKSIGADGAFKLLSEAWSVLSAKGRRSAYDQKRGVKGFQQKVSQPSREMAAPTANGFYNFVNTTTSYARREKSSSDVAPAPPPPPPAPASATVPPHQTKPNTFWTACHRCKMQYEYLRVYLNHNLLCPNCHEPFLAVETGIRANGSNASSPWSVHQLHHQNVNHNAVRRNTYIPGTNTSAVPNVGTAGNPHGVGNDSFNHSNFQWGHFSRTAGVASATASSSTVAQGPNVVHHAYEKVRTEHEEAQAAARKEEAFLSKHYTSRRTATGPFQGNSYTGPSGTTPDRERPAVRGERPLKKRRSIDDVSGNDHKRDEGDQIGIGDGRTDIDRANGISRDVNMAMDSSKARGGIRQSSGLRDLSQHEIRSMLMRKARIEIAKKLAELKLAAAAKILEKRKEKDSTVKVDTCNHNKSDVPMIEKKQKISKKVSSGDAGPDPDKESAEPLFIGVPDPDFHDFDKDRSEGSFEPNQVWAAYDDDDGMPRFYALIQKVISLKPFKMRYSWLNSKNNSELGPLSWISSGFTKTCGEFRVTRYEVCNTVNFFSHKVSWEKGVRGVVRIIPRKGEVWALYRNWSSDWNETTPNEVIHKYDMVEVLEDYNDEQGVSVTPLVKVAGFKTVFHRHMDPREVKIIPRGEMFRLSHQVPSWLLTGEEALNAPIGCRELDPAATPLELLQVITEAKEELAETGVQQPDNEMMKTAEQQKDGEMVEAA